MGSLLYKYLKDKATNEETKKKIIYVDSKFNMYSYEKLNALVESEIEHCKNLDLVQSPCVVVLNNMYSAASIIALLELGYSPIIVNGIPLKSQNQKTLNSYIQQCLLNFKNKHNSIINDNIETNFDLDKQEKECQKIVNSYAVNQPGNGKIGILTSGSQGKPKVIYVDEKLLVEKVFESKYVDEHRIVYNAASISSVSGLFTNLFMPIVSDDTYNLLSDDFDFDLAIRATDVYMPRNYQEAIKHNGRFEGQNNIKRIFFFGEQNSKDMFRDIRKKILLGDNVFINVYGSTECGGLVSEIEEKDIDTLYVYHYDYDNDTIVYSCGDGIKYKLSGGKSTRLLPEDEDKYPKQYRTQFIPCGFVNDNFSLVGKKQTIGELKVRNYNTDDIAAFINGKIYILGRKNNVLKNHFIATYDGPISSLTNKICTTFLDEYNNMCVAIRCSIEENDNLFKNHAMFFRNLSKDYKRIIKQINHQYPWITKIIFLPSSHYKLSGGAKKTSRESLAKELPYGEMILYKLENFETLLKKHIEDSCIKKLGFVPSYSLDDNYNIIFDKKEISMEQIIDLMYELNIIYVYEDENNYHIIYDDVYFFDDDNRCEYFALQRESYKGYAEFDLFEEKLAVDNHDKYARFMGDNIPEIYKSFYDITVEYVFGKTNDGYTIIIPWFYSTYEDYSNDMNKFNEQKREENKNILEKLINEKYPNVDFYDEGIYTPLPITYANELNNNIGHEIILDENNEIVNYTDNQLYNYLITLIKDSHLYNYKHSYRVRLKRKKQK